MSQAGGTLYQDELLSCARLNTHQTAPSNGFKLAVMLTVDVPNQHQFHINIWETSFTTTLSPAREYKFKGVSVSDPKENAHPTLMNCSLSDKQCYFQKGLKKE